MVQYTFTDPSPPRASDKCILSLFHPTSVISPAVARGALVSEGVKLTENQVEMCDPAAHVAVLSSQCG